MQSEPTHTEMYCLDCNYPLNGVAGDNCPECGGWFDAHDATTYSDHPRAPWIIRVFVPVTSLFALCALLAFPLFLIIRECYAIIMMFLFWRE